MRLRHYGCEPVCDARDAERQGLYGLGGGKHYLHGERVALDTGQPYRRTGAGLRAGMEFHICPSAEAGEGQHIEKPCWWTHTGAFLAGVEGPLV